MNSNLHRLLTRQLRKLGLDGQRLPEAEAWSKLLSVIDQTYRHADQDRYTLERSLTISSEEVQALYQRQNYSYEARLRAIFETLEDLIWLKDPDGVYLSCNPQFERFFGARESEIVGKTDYDFVHRELADFFREKDRVAMAAGRPTTNEEWLTFANDGYSGLFETTKTPMVGPDDKVIGVLGIAHDISARKQAEADLRIAAAAFESQEGMMITDANEVILKINKAFTEITGYTRKISWARRRTCSSRIVTTQSFTALCGRPSTSRADGRAKSGTGAKTARCIQNGSPSRR